jgi:ATP-dependent protease ClpP protease subunit
MQPKTIRIDGEIGQDEGMVSAEMVRAQLPTNGTDPIRVSIHSEGGSVFEGFAIYDAFARYAGPKTISVESTAFSIASFIAMAFDDIEMSPNAYLMLHNPRVGMEGDDDELASTASMIGKLKANMIEAYAKRSGKSTEEIAAILKAETYFNASDAVANGFANRITTTPVQARAFARLDNLPHGVVAALFGAGSSGDREPHKGKTMSDSKPVAATVQEIKTAFPKAKSDFIVRCLERQLPMASVAQVAAEEMMTENETLAMKVAAMEDELMKARATMEELASKAKASMTEDDEEEDPAKARAKAEEEEKEEVKAKRTGVAPVARGTSGKPSAKAQWQGEVNARVASGKTRAEAILSIERDMPGLRAAMVAEANAR